MRQIQVICGLGPQKELIPLFYVQGHLKPKEDQGYSDSGCSRHMTGDAWELHQALPLEGSREACNPHQAVYLIVVV